jgi:heterodisulfide reductase subunit C
MQNNASSSSLIDLKSCDGSFRHEVNERSGENVGLCWHCRTCAGGCPYVKAMDYHPHAVFRLVQLGLRKEALESSTIWICVSCNTCSIQCPAAIDIPAIMDALRHMALAEGVKIAQPEIVKFHGCGNGSRIWTWVSKCSHGGNWTSRPQRSIGLRR